MTVDPISSEPAAKIRGSDAASPSKVTAAESTSDERIAVAAPDQLGSAADPRSLPNGADCPA